MKREAISTKETAPAMSPYSQGIRWGNLVFTSGQVGDDPSTGNLVDGGIQEQTRQALENVSAILKAAGTDLAHAIKATVFLVDMNDFAGMNSVYMESFPVDPPARTTVGVRELPPGALVEIEFVAAIE